MGASDHFVSIDFKHFKAFASFSINLRTFNILVGPNNAGKSTILAACRILSAAMRRAEARHAEVIHGPSGPTRGHRVDLRTISIAEENIFHNYEEDEPARITFTLTNKNKLVLYFPEQGVCYLIPDAKGKNCSSPATFKANFNCSIGFVPILGPVEHHEPLFEKEAARLALLNYTAARNFRNIWHHYPSLFPEFKAEIQRTWPGMDIEPPELDYSHAKTRLHMFCPEERKPREIFWAGFGFQVWCQMLTHVIQSRNASLFLIDEPDIYLHSDLQRQLLGILRNLGPDILIATHSIEIIREAEPDDIVIVNKQRQKARRIKNTAQLEDVFKLLGSNANPILTQLAKTRRVVFVEGQDYQIFGRLANKLGYTTVGNRTAFAVVTVEGFNPERIKNLKAGMETTLGVSVSAAAILDRDYRSDAECAKIVKDCEGFCKMVVVHRSKEVENFLLVPAAIDRAAAVRLADRNKRTSGSIKYEPLAEKVLCDFAESSRVYVTGQYLAARFRFEREIGSGMYQETSNEQALTAVEESWKNLNSRLSIVPGKDALTCVNIALQAEFKINVTPTGVIDAMHLSEVPAEVKELIAALDLFTNDDLTSSEK